MCCGGTGDQQGLGGVVFVHGTSLIAFHEGGHGAPHVSLCVSLTESGIFRVNSSPEGKVGWN